MSEAALAALRAECDALIARCAASRREAANFAARLRRTPRGVKEGILYTCAIRNHAALARLLLANGLSPSTVFDGNATPLHLASGRRAIDVVRLLLEAGANANCCDYLGNTALQDAAGRGQLACVRELIALTDRNNTSVDGSNALHLSICGNHLECFKLLLPHFADNIDVRTVKSRNPAATGQPYNHTPLQLACEGGYHAMVKALLAAGASRTARNNTEISCLHSASEYGHLACVTLLIGRPDNQKISLEEIDARDSKGRTPLFMAARNGHRYCCAALLAAGADPDAVTHDGSTALDTAKRNHPGHQELIELLECRGGGPAPLLCAGCGASDMRLRACSACGSASFCSNACMAQFWPAHKAECKRIQAANEELARSRIIPVNAGNVPAPS
jgi:ankyrin repeat protein